MNTFWYALDTMGNLTTLIDKRQLLATVTEAAAKGRLDALGKALALCKAARISTDDAMRAVNLGLSRARLGL